MKQEKVLFVVYRPEWWGCFDSLCKQECSQEHVTCYVLPVPRYERDTNTGALDVNKKHFHPEMLTELPLNANLLDYESVSAETDFAKKHFERIYIHNPYDDKYAVDSVDEVYYSENLKKWTEELIYVPHHLYIGGMPENMVYCPVYEYVDTILLSDERVRYSLDVAYDHKVKIVPSGILEYLDKLNARKEMRQATAQSGQQETAKKRLLYCVSFDDLYYGTEKQIQKMWDIFKYMPTRDDIQFVFRPDEDIAARFEELEPNIVKRYQELCAHFRENEVGIWDESLNSYVAAVEADGIMTTGHPMSSLFSVQGKYVLCVDRESRPIPTEEDRCIPSFWASEVEEDEGGITVWFVPDKTRLICKMSIPSGQVEVVSEVPEEVPGWSRFIDIVRVKDCLYLAPYQVNGIWKYDLKNKIYSKVYLPRATNACMSRMVSYGRYLYLIPQTYPGIVKYDIETEEILILDGWLEEVKSMTDPECMKAPYFYLAVKREANMLYLASAKCGAWLELDLDTDNWKLEKIDVGIGNKGFAGMEKCGDDIWLLPYDNRGIYCWNRVSKEHRVIYAMKDMPDVIRPYMLCLNLGKNIAIFPNRAYNVIKITKDSDDYTFEYSTELPGRTESYLSEFMKCRGMGYQLAERLQDGSAIAYECFDGSFLLLDKELRLIGKYPCRIPPQVVTEELAVIIHSEQYRSEYFGKDHCYVLSEGYGFSEMINFFSQNS